MLVEGAFKRFKTYLDKRKQLNVSVKKKEIDKINDTLIEQVRIHWKSVVFLDYSLIVKNECDKTGTKIMKKRFLLCMKNILKLKSWSVKKNGKI